MPKFEQCARCGEMLSEIYGCCSDNGCVQCAAAETGQAGAERRASPRIRTMVSAVLADPEGDQPVGIMDISAGGARIATDRAPAIGAPLVLTVAGSDRLEARRVWQDGPVTGIMFLDPPRTVIAAMAKVAPAFI